MSGRAVLVLGALVILFGALLYALAERCQPGTFGVRAGNVLLGGCAPS